MHVRQLVDPQPTETVAAAATGRRDGSRRPRLQHRVRRERLDRQGDPRRSMRTSSACSSPTTGCPRSPRGPGYPYYNVGLQLLSKYPIHEPSGADGLYALIEVQPGYAVAFFNTHLDYVAYGPKLLANGSAGRRRGRLGERGAHVVDGDPAAADSRRPTRGRLSDVPDRRLQRAVESRLHRGDHRDPRRASTRWCRGR